MSSSPDFIFHATSLSLVVGAASLPDDVGGVQVLSGVIPVTVPLPQGNTGVVEGEGAMAKSWLAEC